MSDMKSERLTTRDELENDLFVVPKSENKQPEAMYFDTDDIHLTMIKHLGIKSVVMPP